MYIFTIIIGIIILGYFLFMRSSGGTVQAPSHVKKTENPAQSRSNKYQLLEAHLAEISKKPEKASKPKLSFTINELFLEEGGVIIKTSLPIDIFIDNLSFNFDVYCFYLEKKLRSQNNAAPKEENIVVNNLLTTVRSKIPSHRLMTCSSLDGLSAMIRQLNPVFHIDKNLHLIPKIASYVQKLVFIAPTPEQQEVLNHINTKKNIKSFSSFEDFLLKTSTFGLLSDNK